MGADSQEPARPDRRVLGADLVEANRRQPRSPRRERRVMADGIVPAIIWVVLFGGAFLTIGFTFFFGAENLRAQLVMTGGFVSPNLCRVADRCGHRSYVRRHVKVGPEALAALVKDFAIAPSQRPLERNGDKSVFQ